VGRGRRLIFGAASNPQFRTTSPRKIPGNPPVAPPASLRSQRLAFLSTILPALTRSEGQMLRNYYIAAYDIASPKRLQNALGVLKEFATGGQKSVYECPLTLAEREELLQRMALVIDELEDRFCLLRLEPKAKMRTLGIAVSISRSGLFYAGSA